MLKMSRSFFVSESVQNQNGVIKHITALSRSEDKLGSWWLQMCM